MALEVAQNVVTQTLVCARTLNRCNANFSLRAHAQSTDWPQTEVCVTQLRAIQQVALHCGHMEVTITTPKTFNFHRTVLSHGWCALLPFELDKAKWKLVRVLDREQRKPVTVEITSRRNSLKIVTSRATSERAAQRIIRDVRHMFRLDDDLQLFFEVISADTVFGWISEQGVGRLVRSPT